MTQIDPGQRIAVLREVLDRIGQARVPEGSSLGHHNGAVWVLGLVEDMYREALAGPGVASPPSGCGPVRLEQSTGALHLCPLGVSRSAT